MSTVLLWTRDADRRARMQKGLETLHVTIAPLNGSASLAPDRIERVPDVAVIDCTGGEEGWTLYRSFRRDPRMKKVPCLAIVPADRMQTLPEDLDDFLTDPAELPVRVGRILRRRGVRTDNAQLRYGRLAIRPARYEATLDGEPVDLTFQEFELLAFLAARPGRVFERETLLARVWGGDALVGTRTVDVHIRRLRSKIEREPEEFIQTVRGVGYRFRGAERKE